MSCTIATQSADHDRVRFALMNAGQRIWECRDQPVGFPEARDGLAEFCRTELLPHLAADEPWLREVQHCTEGRLVAEVIRAEARTMTAAVYELAATTTACEAVALTRVLHAFLAAHDHHEKLLLAAMETT